MIDELEQLVENGKGRFFGKVVINEEEFYAQTTRLKKALPDDLKKAEAVSRSSSKVLSEANAEAKRLVDATQSESARALGEARQQADRTISDARAQAESLIGDARAQAEGTLGTARQQADLSINNARAQGERIVDDARREAERIVADAKTHAEQLTSEHTVTQNAQQFAQAHQQAALDDAEQTRAQADDYALQVLDRVEGVLLRLQGSIEDGKQQLRDGRAL